MSEVKQCPFCGEKPTVVVDNKLEDALLARAEKAEATIQNKQVVLDAYRQEVTELQDALDISAQVTAKQIAKSAADLQRAEKAEADVARLAQELEEERRWIPVSERLPDAGENNYLTLSPLGEVFIMCFNEFWYSPFDENGDESTINVTHWMPLPPPPEEE